MPVLDAKALDADPEGLAILHGVIHGHNAEGARRVRKPVAGAFDPALRKQAVDGSAPPEKKPSIYRIPVLALEP